MKLHRYILLVVALLALSACDQQSGSNSTDGIKDALDARPNEKMLDAGESLGEAVKDAGHDLKDAVQDK